MNLRLTPPMKHVAFGIAALCLSSTVFAQTKDDVVKAVNAAVAHFQKVGAEQALKDISSQPEWKDKGLSVFVQKNDGTALAHSTNARLIGKNTMELKDPNGKQFIKEMTQAASKGEGWVDYEFMDPATKKMAPRSAYVKRIPAFDGFAGSSYTR